MVKLKQKIVIIALIVIMLLNTCANTIYAAVEIDTSQLYLEKIGQADYHLKYYREDRNKYTYLICSIVGYYDGNGNFNPTYCMNKNLSGAEDSPYNVTVDSLLDNDKVWRVIKNGYPYKNAQELGLSSEYNAYAVTKWAVYCVLGESNLDYYMAESNDAEALAMLNALRNLVNIGLNGTEKQDENPLKITKVTDFIEDGNYYSQEYKVTSTADFETFKISNTRGLPEGSFIANTSGENQTTFNKNEIFKIMISKNSLGKNIDVNLEITAECKSYVILEGKTTVTDRQNYVVTAGEFAKFTQEMQLKETTNTGKIKINKIDSETKKPIQGVEFELKDNNGNTISKATTDLNGVANFTNLYQGKYTLVETKAQQGYISIESEIGVDVKYNQTTTINVENEKQKGQIKIVKIDKENNGKLEGVKFDVVNEKGDVLEQIITDKNGEAVTSRYAVKDYKNLYIKEIETKEGYRLNDEIISVELKANEVTEVKIENEKEKGQIKIIKTSKDKNLINEKQEGSPIENVKFEIYDSNNNLVDKISTSIDGIAISKLLEKGNYYIKEIEAGKWYLLNEDIFTVEIKEHKEVVEIEIANESEKPSVDIEKTGIEQAIPNEEIKYDFIIKNTGNVLLENFTWYDYLPTDFVRITKLMTGTYNQDLNYNIYYKTNKEEYRLLQAELNTQTNNYIDFTNIQLNEDEYITDFKIDFGTVDVGFESVIHPYILVKVNSDAQNDDIFTNKTRIEGNNKTFIVWDEDKFTTKVYKEEIKVEKIQEEVHKKVEIEKLPKTGY